MARMAERKMEDSEEEALHEIVSPEGEHLRMRTQAGVRGMAYDALAVHARRLNTDHIVPTSKTTTRYAHIGHWQANINVQTPPDRSDLPVKTEHGSFYVAMQSGKDGFGIHFRGGSPVYGADNLQVTGMMPAGNDTSCGSLTDGAIVISLPGTYHTGIHTETVVARLSHGGKTI